MRVIGLDIGGANLKASDGEQHSASRPFAIWNDPSRLTVELQRLLSEFRPAQHIAVTMTAELADCFESKSAGVDLVLRSVERAVDVPVHVWQRGGEFVSPGQARDLVPLVAAANWHALATWAGRMTPAGAGLLLDVGSTTTDLIPLLDGLPEAGGGSDLERLATGQLIYRGVRRTPVCAVSRSVLLENTRIPLAAEWFATIRDVFLIRRDVPPDPDDRETADGRPATREAALSRLARMLCCDRSELSDSELTLIADQIASALTDELAEALGCILSRTPPVQSLLLSGEGEFLAGQIAASEARLAGVPVISLTRSLGESHATAACAYALSRLGHERIPRAEVQI